MFYTSAWCQQDEEQLERSVPLRLLGDSLTKFSSDTRLVVLFLEGFKNLSVHYLQELSAKNIDIIDFTEDFAAIIRKYSNIDVHYNHFERNCLLRWLAFKEYRRLHDTEQFWHLDSDISFNLSLEELAAATRGLTFMTLGCPVFLTVSDENWFTVYERELGRLEANVTGYLKNYLTTLSDCQKNDHDKFNLSLFHNPLNSDQDFLEYLISSGLIQQSNLEEIVSTNLYYIQNPLDFFQMSAYLPETGGVNLVSVDSYGHLIYRERKIPFIHYQGAFSVYISALYLMLKQLSGGCGFISKKMLNYRVDAGHLYIPWISRIFLKFLKIIKVNNLNRGEIIRALSALDSRGQPEIVQLLNVLINNHRA